MTNDCRTIPDNLNDPIAQVGALITGSDAVDISGATMTAGVQGWNILIKTAAPAVQNPRLKTTVGLYLDIDGRAQNNAIGGPRLGADTVYALVRENGSWRLTKEVLNAKNNIFEVAPTGASYSITAEGYVLNIPFAEAAQRAPAYWKTGVAVEDIKQLSVDYAPEVGMSCAPVLAAKPVFISMDRLAQIAAGAIVIAVAAVIIWKRIKNKKEKYDLQEKSH